MSIQKPDMTIKFKASDSLIIELLTGSVGKAIPGYIVERINMWPMTGTPGFVEGEISLVPDKELKHPDSFWMV